MEVEEILEECRDLVEQVCVKFGYDVQDKEGNDSLKTVLSKVIPAMLKGRNPDERKLFYQMLSHTPIVITESITQESYEKLLEEYIGKDVNQHITEEDADLGEYGKDLGAGAYVSEPILDENMNLQGKKSFIYIQRITGKAMELLGTDINVPHLIHELGHAWHSEKDQFIKMDDGTLKERVGTAEFIYSFSKTSDNRWIKKCTNVSGLMIEESMNTRAEEIAMANYLGIPLEEMQKEYRASLVPSEYQGYMADFVSYMLKQLGEDHFEHYRLYGDTESRDKINALMQKTKYWIDRESDIVHSSNSPRSYDKKRAIIASIENPRVQEFFKKYESIYFPDISGMTPIEKIDNVLAQKYNMNMTKYNMGIDNYKAFLERLGYEGFSLINQAATLLNSNKKEKSVEEDTQNTGTKQTEISTEDIYKRTTETNVNDRLVVAQKFAEFQKEQPKIETENLK